MTSQQEKEFEKIFLEKLKNQFTQGMIAGSKAICSVILEKANNTELTYGKRIEEIIKFCNTSLGKDK